MSNHLSLALFIPVYFLAMVFLLGGYIRDTQLEELETAHVSQVSNFCSDAATEELLISDDLEMDYIDMGKITISPEEALDTWCRLFCVNYNLPCTEENCKIIRNRYLKLFSVIAYDGYYKAVSTKINDEGDYDFVFTPKIPYSYEANGGVYNLTLGKVSTYFYKDDSVMRVGNPFSQELTSYLISSKITDDFVQTLEDQYVRGVYNAPYIPSEMSRIRGTNTIVGPTVISYIDDFDMNVTHKIMDVSIGATAIIQAKMIIGYTRDGRQWYCYHDQLQRALKLEDSEMEVWVDTYGERVFTSATQAAKEGYWWDPQYMSID